MAWFHTSDRLASICRNPFSNNCHGPSIAPMRGRTRAPIASRSSAATCWCGPACLQLRCGVCVAEVAEGRLRIHREDDQQHLLLRHATQGALQEPCPTVGAESEDPVR